jgi:hypothetical protein
MLFEIEELREVILLPLREPCEELLELGIL